MATHAYAYNYDDYETGKSRMSFEISGDDGFAVSVDMSKKEAKKFMASFKEAMKEIN
jgi:hypothetical protein